ncbi:MAG: right-handed parallel beta-helix repeat-containing protein [Armatimonadetes bacterium]|nr:right-handed parallel beta-helix repeat-containing protein [Armatimonadota bacterium]
MRWWLISLMVVIAMVSSAEGKAAGRTFYVSLEGNDAWSGTKAGPNRGVTDGPFATIQRARDAVRALKAAGAPKAPVTVYLRGGNHFLAEPLELTAEDSGAEGTPVTYAAYRGEKPVLSAGRKIKGWKPVTVEGRKLWAASVPEAKEGWFFHQLWVNGERSTRARHPNRGYLNVQEVLDVTPQTEWSTGQTRFRFKKGDIRAWPTAEDAEVVAMCRWVDSHLPITAVDEKERLVSFGKRSVFVLEPGDPYYVEHALELLDTPGEWYLDRRAGTLYYMPVEGEDMEKAEVIAPALSRVLLLNGKPEAGQFVEHLRFRGLTFSHAEWYFPKDAGVEWFNPEVGGFGQAAIGVPGTVAGEGVRQCIWEKCAVAHTGTYALQLGRGCQNNRLTGCDLYDLGAGGVKIGETAVRKEAAEQAHNNTLENCHIHDGGLIFHSAIGVWIGQSYDNRVAGCHIHDFYYSGFSVGWTWGYGETLARGNIIENNHVHHIGVRSNGDGPILSDMGGIYTLGMQPGTVVRGNVFHDIAGIRYGGWGIYFDEGSTHIVAENNIVYRTTHGGFHQHYGKENTVRNNIFAFGRDQQIQATRPEPHTRFIFENNIVYWREGATIAGGIGDYHFSFDRNLYWKEDGGDIRFGDLFWEEWQAKGLDKNSVKADPLFRDVSKDDFTLKPGSPALKLGFKPIKKK